MLCMHGRRTKVAPSLIHYQNKNFYLKRTEIRPFLSLLPFSTLALTTGLLSGLKPSTNRLEGLDAWAYVCHTYIHTYIYIHTHPYILCTGVFRHIQPFKKKIFSSFLFFYSPLFFFFFLFLLHRAMSFCGRNLERTM